MKILDSETDKKLIFSTCRYTHFTHLNTIFEYCHACVIFRNTGDISLFFNKGFYISDLELVRMLIKEFDASVISGNVAVF